jgi:hypothetical protein
LGGDVGSLVSRNKEFVSNALFLRDSECSHRPELSWKNLGPPLSVRDDARRAAGRWFRKIRPSTGYWPIMPPAPATGATLSFVFVGRGFSLRAVLSVNQ